MSSALLALGSTPKTAIPGDTASLTGVRFLAALTIVLGHSYAPLGEITMIGMPLFFTLSGFIIHYVYSDTFAAGWRSATVKFCSARFSRIYPLYFIFLLVAVVTTPMGSVFHHSGDMRLILAYLFACYTWVPLSVDGMSTTNWYYSIAWSVPTEIFFYVSYAVFFYRIFRIRNAKICFVSLVVFCILVYALFYILFLTRDIWEAVALHHFGGFVPRTTDFSNSLYRWFLYSSPYGRIFEFVGGCLTCQLFLLIKEKRSLQGRLNFELLTWTPCVLIVVIVVAYYHIAPYQHWLDLGDHRFLSFFVSLHMNFLLAPLCYMLIFCLAYSRSTLSRALSSGAVVLLGEISYSTYLGHPLAQSFVLNSALGYLPHWSTVAQLLVIYLFSWMFYVALEVPCKVGLRHFFAMKPARALHDVLGPAGAWATAIVAIAVAVAVALSFESLVRGRTSRAEATAPTALAELPVLQPVDLLPARWDGIEGLAVEPFDGPAVTGEAPLRLISTLDKRRHRLGVMVQGITSDRPYRVSAWLRTAAPIEVMLDLRDDQATHYGKAVFKLPDAAVVRSQGNATSPGAAVDANGWTRVWADMTFTGEKAVVYVTLLDPSEAEQFAGDGQLGIGFGGIDVARSHSD